MTLFLPKISSKGIGGDRGREMEREPVGEKRKKKNKRDIGTSSMVWSIFESWFIQTNWKKKICDVYEAIGNANWVLSRVFSSTTV